MPDSAVVEKTASPVAAPDVEKKSKKAAAVVDADKVKKISSVSPHPPTHQMVDAAIKALDERGGSSLQSIKKYLSVTYKVDAQKLAPFIRKYLKSGVDSGRIIQTKGNGATGSFKLSAYASKNLKPIKPVVERKKYAPKKNPSTVQPHPPTHEMVDAAIKTLNERGGSSLSAIKKYLAENYKVDAQRLALYIRKYLKSAIDSGKLAQTKGSGCTGSFKFSDGTSKGVKAKKLTLQKKKSTVKKPSAAEKKKTVKAKTAKKEKPAKKAPVTKAKTAAADKLKRTSPVKKSAAKKATK